MLTARTSRLGSSAPESCGAEQCQRREDRDELAAEIAPGVGTDDVGWMAVDRSAQRLLQAPDPGREQQARKADRKEGGLPWRKAERGVAASGNCVAHSARTNPPTGRAMPPPM